MYTKELELAASLLREASEEFEHHGCNDWEFPADWSLAERQKFVLEYYTWNGDPENFEPDFLELPDFAVMDFLAHKLSEIAGLQDAEGGDE